MDLDKKLDDRNKAIAKRLREADEFSAADFFISERVVNSVNEDKIFLGSFDPKKY
ncbi:hypothetical protein [Bradyrhizobium sp. BR 1433]|uniref:hypothetical protein n=1 Tax=Bradyrhizobium sp. BR 1433 TaxID=3447967 RepID=UPI003EE63CF8